MKRLLALILFGAIVSAGCFALAAGGTTEPAPTAAPAADEPAVAAGPEPVTEPAVAIQDPVSTGPSAVERPALPTPPVSNPAVDPPPAAPFPLAPSATETICEIRSGGRELIGGQPGDEMMFVAHGVTNLPRGTVFTLTIATPDGDRVFPLVAGPGNTTIHGKIYGNPDGYTDDGTNVFGGPQPNTFAPRDSTATVELDGQVLCSG